MDRGFYFSSSSYLVSNTSWVLSPRFCFSIFFRAFSPGIVFKIIDDSKTYLSVTYNITIQYKFTSTDGINNFTHIVNYSYSNQWAFYTFNLIQYQGYFYYSAPGLSENILGKEFRMDSNSAKFYFGSQLNDSFQGFITYSALKNTNLCLSKTSTYINCLYNQYQSPSCLNSPSTCSNPFIVDSSCRLCFSTNCTSCTGYLPEDCNSCSTGDLNTCYIGKNCLEGFGFNCTSCKPGFTLSKGLCINTPTNFSTIVLRLDKFTQYQGEFFQSGADASTYSPFNNPEPDDPKALSNRGYWFNYTQYMYASSLV